MNSSLPTPCRSLLLILIFFCLGCLPGLWTKPRALAGEREAGTSQVDIQDERISVSAKDIPLRLLCQDIEDKSGIRFRIQDALLGDRLSIEFENFPILKGIKRLLAHMNYMLCFDQRNKLSEVFIVGRTELSPSRSLRKPLSPQNLPRVRRLSNRGRR